MIDTLSLRWYLKKTARASVAASAWAALPLGSTRAQAARVRVLTYHRFGDAPGDPFCISAGDFEKQMAYLASRGLALSLKEVEEFLAGRRPVKDGAVLVTIDDGFQSLYTIALPILKRYGIPAVAFVSAGLIDLSRTSQRERTRQSPPENYLTWEELVALPPAGIEIGSHAWTHRSLGRMSRSEAEHQVRRSKAVLERQLGRAITAFAYPFGTRADFNAMTATLLRQSGYTCAFTSQHGAFAPGADAFELPRVKVENGEGEWMFRSLLRGGLDNWRWIDRSLWRLQASDRG